MRILIAHEAPGGAGGVESYLESVMPALLARGHAVALLHLDPLRETSPTRLQFEGIPTIGISDVGMPEALRQVGEWGPDICWIHNMRDLSVDEQLAERYPVVKMMHGYFGTCISGQKCHGFPSVAPCSRQFGAQCLTLYLPRRCGHLHPLRMVQQFEWTVRQRRLFDSYTRIVVASGHMAAEYARNGVAVDRLVTAPLFPTTAAAAQSRVRPSEPTVLFAGRMTGLKGARVLLKAVAGAGARLGRGVHVVFAGDGPEREHLRRLAQEMRVSCSFPGWVTGAERTALMRRATVIAVPSVWPEPFGLIGLEAAVHGVPAVGFDVGGISEWLRDGVNGRLVRGPGDFRAFGSALAEVLGDPDLLSVLECGALAAAAEMSRDRHLAIVEDALAAHSRTAASA